MKVLVTGGLGYIGSHTCVALAEAGYEVLIVDNLSVGKASVLERLRELTDKPIAFRRADIRDRTALNESRQQIKEAIQSLLPHAESAGVKLAIEPLHPMYADTRSAVNTLSQANDMAEEIQSPWVGVAVDVYHLWWDPSLEQEIKRCGKNGNLFAFHICDWNVPTTDMLNDRGLMGEGCINVPLIRSWVEDAGFTGFNEVEIFSNTFWKTDQSEFLRKIITAYKNKS